MLKKILLVLVALVVVFLLVVALQPSDYRVERMTTIAAPPSQVFAEVNDFHKWEAWSPWAKLDPDAKITFEGPDAGEGAVLAWAGDENVGVGKMTQFESRPDEHIKIKVDFVEPFEGSTNSEFSFKPQGDQTDVAWAMHGHHNFVEKAFCLVMKGLDMMGDDLEKGLAQLKSVVEQPS
jgi:uncharacterized protein YndB with AHSA1/START domain